MPNPWEKELNFLKKQAFQAGEIMRRHYKGEFKVYTKPDNSKVTDVDLEISELVQKQCGQEFPEVVLFSEESENPPIDRDKDHFIIDELDGTSYFIAKMKGFSHQAAFYRGGEGIKVGLVYFPVDDIMLFGVRGHGAFMETGGVAQQLPRREKAGDFDKLKFAHPARYRGNKYRRMFESMGVDESQILLTTALRTLQFAQGDLDVAIFAQQRIPEWDLSGEKVIVEELGYSHSYLDGVPVQFGVPPRPNNPGYLICHPGLRERLSRGALDWLATR